MPVDRPGAQILYREKPVDVTDGADLKAKVSDVQFFGDPDTWSLVSKAWSKSQGWMKSTKAMNVASPDGSLIIGVLVQVTTERTDATGSTALAEAVTFVPGAMVRVIDKDPANVHRAIVPIASVPGFGGSSSLQPTET